MHSKSLLCTALCILAFCALSVAQTATPPQAPVACAIGNPTSNPNCGLHFITEANVYQNSDGTTAQSFGAVIPLFKHVRVGVAEVLNPDAKGNESFAVVEYGAKLGALVKSFATPNNALNLSNIRIYGRFGLGDEQTGLGSASKQRNFAYGLWGGADIKVGQVAGGTANIGFRVGFVGVPAAGEHFVLGNPNSFQIAPTVAWTF